MMRRFVNLVSHKWCGRGDSSSSSIYSLHRLNVADHLFYPSTADAEKAKAEAANKEDGGAPSWPPAIQRMRQLPAPTMTFQAASRALQVDADVRFFALLCPRDSESRIIFSNKLGHSTLYDADANCDVWLGFAGDGRNLCAASGLSGAMEMAPALQHVWRDAGKVPGNWRPTCPQLLDLGGGRFCIAKTCMVMPDTEYDEYSGPGIEVAVLSGVELLTGGGDRPPGSIDIVEHKSLGYVCRSDSIRWVI